jgi:Holliday junction resolvase RusA-like endonuclease
MITIHGSIPSKKNSKKIIQVRGRILIVPSTKFEKWHKEAVKEMMSQHYCLEGKKVCRVEINLYAPDKRKGDLTNRAESLMDLLVDCGIIKDDNWFEIPQVVLGFGGVDRQNPRVEIFLDVV